MVDVVRHRQRLDIVEYLEDHDGEASVTVLGTTLAADDDSYLSDVLSTLNQLHLPKLVECGLVEYHQQTGTVRLLVSQETVEALLDHVRDGD